MDQICPWDRFTPSHLNFCEEKLCSWIVKPAETWSNLSFIFVGLLVIYLARKENLRHLAPIGVVGVVLGIFSGFFHASGTHIGGWLDTSSMLLFTGLGIGFNLNRYNGTKVLPTFFVAVVPVSILIFFYPVLGIILFGTEFLVALGIEYRISKNKLVINYRPLKQMLVVFLVALGIWVLDLTKVWCNPANHVINGHAIWHLLCGTTFYFIYRFYAQFTELGQNKAPL